LDLSIFRKNHLNPREAMKIEKSPFWILFASLFIAIGAMTSHAQPLQLSFSDAWKIAQTQNAKMRQARLEMERAEAQVGEAYAGAMPSVSATGYYQRNFIIPEMVTELPPEFGGGTTTFKFQQDNLFSGSVELSQPIYVAGKVGLALKIAKLYRQVIKERLVQTKSELKRQITQLYFGAVVAREWERVSQETYDQMRAHLEKVENMYNEGLVSEYDLIRSRVELSNFYPQVISAQTAREVAFEALSIALDLPKDQAFELTDDLTSYPIGDEVAENHFELALQHRSEIKQIDQRQRILDNLLKIEKHGVWWPNVFLVGGYSKTAQEPDFDVDNFYWMENLYGGISLTIPIFDGFKAKNRAQQVRVDLKELNLQREQLIRGINLEIIQAKSRLREAMKNVKAQQEGVQLARKGLEIAEVRYENGLATQLEVLDAQVALNQANTNELSAYYDAITAKADLEKAMGKF